VQLNVSPPVVVDVPVGKEWRSNAGLVLRVQLSGTEASPDHAVSATATITNAGLRNVTWRSGNCAGTIAAFVQDDTQHDYTIPTPPKACAADRWSNMSPGEITSAEFIVNDSRLDPGSCIFEIALEEDENTTATVNGKTTNSSTVTMIGHVDNGIPFRWGNPPDRELKLSFRAPESNSSYEIDLAVKNRGNTSIWENNACPNDIRITDQNGTTWTLARGTNRSCAGKAPLELKPSALVTAMIQWNGTVWNGTTMWHVAPGSYVAHAFMDTWADRNLTTGQETLEANASLAWPPTLAPSPPWRDTR
jgi:hypothetical protein